MCEKCAEDFICGGNSCVKGSFMHVKNRQEEIHMWGKLVCGGDIHVSEKCAGAIHMYEKCVPKHVPKVFPLTGDCVNVLLKLSIFCVSGIALQEFKNKKNFNKFVT